MATRPKKTLLPVISTEEDREKAIRGLCETHGYSIDEMAYVLDITKRTVYRWISQGMIIPVIRMGKTRIVGRDIRRVYFS